MSKHFPNKITKKILSNHPATIAQCRKMRVWLSANLTNDNQRGAFRKCVEKTIPLFRQRNYTLHL